MKDGKITYREIFILIALFFGLLIIPGIALIDQSNLAFFSLCIGGGGLILTGIALCVYIYFSPANKEKRLERKRIKLEQERIENERIENEKRKELEKLSNIRKTVILSHATLIDKDNAMTRGIVGMALIGTPGAILGTSTAKERQTTTFLIVYNDNTRETREVENGSELYNIYIQYLEV